MKLKGDGYSTNRRIIQLKNYDWNVAYCRIPVATKNDRAD